MVKNRVRIYITSTVKKTSFLTSTSPWIFFTLILILGILLRFHNIEESVSFGWDQARDSWAVRDIVQGKLALIGPKTGVGDFHLGPIYFYLMAPFYYLVNLDPMGSNYFNIIANIINFLILFLVSRKIFNNHAALFIILIYATNEYLMGSRIPWNVTLMPGISALIFFSILKVYTGNYKWIFVTWTLCGFSFNFHFTAVFLPLIVILSFIFIKDKWRALRYSLFSLPFYFIWFMPNIIHEFQNANRDYYKFRDFLNHYYIGFHPRFMLHRLPDSIIQFGFIFNLPNINLMKFIVPILFLLTAFRFGERDKIFAYLISLWFLLPLIGFTIYGGPISDYYFIFSVPMVLFVIWYLQDKLVKLKHKSIIALSVIFWSIYIFFNIYSSWIKTNDGGLKAQKVSTKEEITLGNRIEYDEGDIKSYLYTIWTEDGKRF